MEWAFLCPEFWFAKMMRTSDLTLRADLGRLSSYYGYEFTMLEIETFFNEWFRLNWKGALIAQRKPKRKSNWKAIKKESCCIQTRKKPRLIFLLNQSISFLTDKSRSSQTHNDNLIIVKRDDGLQQFDVYAFFEWFACLKKSSNTTRWRRNISENKSSEQCVIILRIIGLVWRNSSAICWCQIFFVLKKQFL